MWNSNPEDNGIQGSEYPASACTHKHTYTINASKNIIKIKIIHHNTSAPWQNLLAGPDETLLGDL